jgi:hypothetical protein
MRGSGDGKGFVRFFVGGRGREEGGDEAGMGRGWGLISRCSIGSAQEPPRR